MHTHAHTHTHLVLTPFRPRHWRCDDSASPPVAAQPLPPLQALPALPPGIAMPAQVHPLQQHCPGNNACAGPPLQDIPLSPRPRHMHAWHKHMPWQSTPGTSAAIPVASATSKVMCGRRELVGMYLTRNFPDMLVFSNVKSYATTGQSVGSSTRHWLSVVECTICHLRCSSRSTNMSLGSPLHCLHGHKGRDNPPTCAGHQQIVRLRCGSSNVTSQNPRLPTSQHASQ